jgi:hypothetical protein
MQCLNVSYPQASLVTEEMKQLADIVNKESADRNMRIHAARRLENLLFTAMSCTALNPQLVQNYREILGHLNIDNIRDLPPLHKYDGQIACLVQAILNRAEPANLFSLDNRERLRTYITQLQQIGDPSIEGYALNANSLFVIKAPRNPQNDDILHEAVVGLQLNRLRELIPNFMYVYGLARCSPPVLEDKTSSYLVFI